MKRHPHIARTLLFLMLLGWMQGMQGQENLEIRKIHFKGNKTFSDKELKQQLNLKGATWVEKKLLKRQSELFAENAYQQGIDNLTRFYQTEGFLKTTFQEPDIHIKRDKITLTIPLTEGAPMVIGSVFSGNMAEFLTKKKATKRLLATPGKRFRDEWMKADGDLLTRSLTEKGYAYATMQHHILADTTSMLVDVQWMADTGPLCTFGKTTLTPVARTPERITRKQLAYREGEAYSPTKLNKTQQQIYDLGTYRVASVKAQLTQPPTDTVHVAIKLTEAPGITTRFGVGYGKEDLFRAFVELQKLNFPGGVRRTTFYASHSAIEPYLIKTTITQPAVWGPKSSVSLTPFIRNQKEPGYKLISYGTTLSWIQRLSTHLTGQANFSINQVLLDTSTVARISQNLTKQYARTGIETGLVYDNALPRFDPTRGWIVTGNTQYITVFSGDRTRFFKHQLEVKNYQQVTPSLVVATRIKAGTIDLLNQSVAAPVDDRFFAGGSRSVRGWARQQLGPVDADGIPSGGHTLTEGSMEARQKLMGPLSVVGFVDWGNVWEPSGHLSLTDLHWAAGGGLRFATPIGPIGIDAAKPVYDSAKSWQIHFNIGHPF